MQVLLTIGTAKCEKLLPIWRMLHHHPIACGSNDRPRSTEEAGSAGSAQQVAAERRLQGVFVLGMAYTWQVRVMICAIL
jgi:hypothetical protein